MKPPIITSSAVCTRARVLTFSSRDAGVAEGVDVGVGVGVIGASLKAVIPNVLVLLNRQMTATNSGRRSFFIEYVIAPNHLKGRIRVKKSTAKSLNRGDSQIIHRNVLRVVFAVHPTTFAHCSLGLVIISDNDHAIDAFESCALINVQWNSNRHDRSTRRFGLPFQPPKSRRNCMLSG